MKHTKGKWDRAGNEIKVSGRGTIASCPSPNHGGVLEFIANAHLIAAAPEMYEALKTINRAYNKSSNMVELYEPMERVLKALGEGRE